MDDKAKADWVFDFSQRCLAEHPVLVVGSGASAAHSLPTMGQLADYLIEKIEADGVPADAEDVWARFKEVVFEQGLEQAIDEALLWRHEKLYNTLRLLTWECVRGPEEIVRSLATADKTHIPLCKLITYLFRSHHRKISIVTTNYDRIPEYAVDCVDACAWTGFHGSYFGRWLGFSPPLEFWRSNKRVQQNTVEILKVHGSLDWFMNSAKQPVRLIGIDKVPVDHSALIVPPSLRKSEEVLMAPLRDILAHTDYTLSNANGFFCVGYGFNDEHIQIKLLERAKTKKIPIVLLTKTITDRVREIFLKSDHEIQFLILEEGTGVSTRCFSHIDRAGFEIEGHSFWDLRHFMNEVV